MKRTIFENRALEHILSCQVCFEYYGETERPCSTITAVYSYIVFEMYRTTDLEETSRLSRVYVRLNMLQQIKKEVSHRISTS